jgi:subtilisin family serine protease
VGYKSGSARRLETLDLFHYHGRHATVKRQRRTAMRGDQRLLLIASLVMLGGLCPLEGSEKIGGRLFPLYRSAGPEDRFLVWVTLTDKGNPDLRKADPDRLVSPRSLERRRAVLPAGRLVDASDFPVEEAYLGALRDLGLVVRQRSKWLNAVSGTATAAQISAIASLPFVSEIELVYRLPRSRVRPDRESPSPPEAAPLRKSGGSAALDYGPSLAQVSLLKIPEVHSTGNSAQGIMIGVFDNGFRLPTHESLATMAIFATRDFVDHKQSVIPNNPDPKFGTHGVNTLSTIGGNRSGQLIGPAFGATYVLGRTENDSSETPIEEDNWVAAIEWADSLGVQVTSTSLGYLDYDWPHSSWTWRDMDGKTTKISRAAAMAASKGIVVVNSAGNEGMPADTTINSLIAPADADSILAVGAVTPQGVRTYFSSVGPTTSVPARIKPDIMATGSSIYCASSTLTNGYTSVQGTSFSCPLAAGVVALMLRAAPTATPMQVIQSLKMTASQSSAPDNRMGWGIIDAQAAISYLTSLVSVPDQGQPQEYVLEQNYPNPFNPETRMAFTLPSQGYVTLRLYDVLGREIRTLADGEMPAGRHVSVWDGTDASGGSVASGIYVYRLDAVGPSGQRISLSRKMMLLR